MPINEDAWTKLATLRDHVTQIEILKEIIHDAEKFSQLDNPLIVHSYTVQRLRGRIALMSGVEGYRNVGELEPRDIKSPTYKHFDFALEKDRVKIGISDEAQIDQLIGDSFSTQRHDASIRLATMMEERIAEQIMMYPQHVTYDVSQGVDNFFYFVAAHVKRKLLPYYASCAVMSDFMYQVFWGLINKGYLGFANYAAKDLLPYGKGLPVAISNHINDDHIYFVTNQIPAVGVAKGKTIPRLWEDQNKGATVFQIDTFRQAFSKIVTTWEGETECNKGIVSVKVENIPSRTELVDEGIINDNVVKSTKSTK